MLNKKRLMVIFSIILSLIMVSNVLGIENVTTYKPKYGTTTSNVTLRYQSSTNSSNKLDGINKNTNLKIIGEQNNFYIVQLKNNKVGFVSKDYIELNNTPLSESKTFYSLTPKEYETTSNAIVRIRSF